MAFLILLAIPLVLGVVGFVVLKSITWKEFLVQALAQVVVAGSSAGIIYSSNVSDTETLNGVVTNKKQVRVSCSHSYNCNCRNKLSCSGTGKNRHCSTRRVCDTCYEHANDWDWDVFSSVGSFTIGRVDRRGSYEPPRWSAVTIGEPAAVSHSFDNYIKASPNTLFRHQGLQEKYAKFIPAYPNDIHDYYRLNRLVLVNGAKIPDPGAWNQNISALNGRLGPKRQVNMIVVVAQNLPDDYYYALEEAWVGGKKNDTILVIGVDQQLRPTWAVVMAWSLNKLFEVKLRDDIMDLPTLTREGVINSLDRNVSAYYKRKPMKDFEYLAASIAPSTTQWVISLLIGILIAAGLVFLSHKHDIFNEE